MKSQADECAGGWVSGYEEGIGAEWQFLVEAMCWEPRVHLGEGR